MNPFLRRYLKLGWHLMPCHYRSKAGLMRWDKASANPPAVGRMGEALAVRQAGGPM